MADCADGYNNGDLQATMSCLKSRGWSSNDHLTKATRELLDKELIVRTRRGGFFCNLLFPAPAIGVT
ncbi:hypothetical protein ACTL6P_19325 [Endozoicomonas acroporae]|uniref:hypothetical protein n=1 Tax=Endozoicomonas acroporae TaxID=1701104 RepID=UPI0011AFC12F|nr:hypothetical protein [Endozoicomonas acroporae]